MVKSRNNDVAGATSIWEIEDKNETGKKFETNESSDRQIWGSKINFMLSVMGFNIGFGNMLRFPYICLKNGGGTFLFPYFIFLLLLGIPLFMLELGMGQYSSLSPILFWNKLCPALKGIGWCSVAYSAVFNIYYNIQMSWVLNYLFYSFYTPLPWSSCNNDWNTNKCYESKNHSEVYYDGLKNVSFLSNTSSKDSCSKIGHISASEEFWEHEVLKISDGITDIDGLSWSLLLGLIFTWCLIYACLAKGIHSLGKVVYVTVLAPYFLLMILLIRGLTLPGGIAGIKYYLRIDFKDILKPTVWLEAALQIFWSLAPCWGITISMASHNEFFNNIYRDAIVLPILSGLTSFYAGFVTFSYVGILSKQLGTSVDCVMKKGPGLAFVIYPEALAGMPLSQFWSVVFFILMMCLGLDSSFASFEVVYHSLVDIYPKQLKKREWLTRGILCFITFVLAIPLTTTAGQYIYQLIDWYQISLFMFMALAEVLCFAFCYGTDRITENIKLMTGVKLTRCWSLLWKFIVPLILIWLQITAFLEYIPVNYGDYNYPNSAVVFGWILGIVLILPLPLMTVHEIYKAVCIRNYADDLAQITLKNTIISTFKARDSWENNAKFYCENLTNTLIDEEEKEVEKNESLDDTFQF